MAQDVRSLQEVDVPNTLDHMFDYDLPPKIVYESPIYEEIDGEVIKFDPQEALTRDLVAAAR